MLRPGGCGCRASWNQRRADSRSARQTAVLLVEKEPIVGGAGINTGTHTQQDTAGIRAGALGWDGARRLFGVDLSLRREATVGDFTCHERYVKSQERRKFENLLTQRGVVTIHGLASFVDPHTLSVAQLSGSRSLVCGEKILIATGSSPLRPSRVPF